MTATIPFRVPPGSPPGGQFAARTRGESAPLVMDDDGAAALLRAANLHARSLARLRPTQFADQVDDIAADAVLEFLANAQRRRNQGLEPVDNVGGYVRATIRNYGLDGRGAVARASSLISRCEARRAELVAQGVTLTPAQFDAMIEKTRLAMPVTMRPSADAVAGVRTGALLSGAVTSLDAASDEGNPNSESLGVTIAAPPVDDDAFDADSTGAAVLTSLGDGARRATVARSAFTALAERRPHTPVPVPGAVAAKRATRLRKAVNEDGALDSWLDAHNRGDDADDLFVPFGDLTIDQKDAVVDLLEDFPAYRKDIWLSALSASIASAPTARTQPADAWLWDDLDFGFGESAAESDADDWGDIW